MVTKRSLRSFRIRAAALACIAAVIMATGHFAGFTGPSVAQTAATSEGARNLLSEFLKPGADHAALTARLRPAPGDYGAVYKPPLADRIATAHAGLWASGAAIAPNDGQSELLMVFATTDQLIAGDDVLNAFPGGYEQVRQYLHPGFPIVRFKFVAPGERLGMAFDGLVHVNGRWVLMPKPWRALE